MLRLVIMQHNFWTAKATCCYFCQLFLGEWLGVRVKLIQGLSMYPRIHYIYQVGIDFTDIWLSASQKHWD